MSRPTHPKCGKSFPGGSGSGHCASCCHTFIGLSAFEQHRVGEHGTPERRCLELPDADGKFWEDARGHWHHGQRLTAEQAEERFGKRGA